MTTLARYPLLGRDFNLIDRIITDSKAKIHKGPTPSSMIAFEVYEVANLLNYMEYLQNEISRLHCVIGEFDQSDHSGFWEEHRRLNASPVHRPFDERQRNTHSARPDEDGKVLQRSDGRTSVFGSSDSGYHDSLRRLSSHTTTGKTDRGTPK